ncbi:hypothetical protein LshimejAT787_0301230 [Lyophyllum shimeji]|uniref:Uncharacterized protein n=1 Tax=Lyophyllum shimeji TaxID=47721 RepID=A0A9P3PGV8_LYOSH|nr:hypothetical protein LshimejAT787_0301230 [Lyophyllum shimeji]
MASEHTLKRKVTVKLTYTEASPTRPTSRSISRPTSPVKFQPPAPSNAPIKPKAKVNSSAQIGTARKPAAPRTTPGRPGTSDGPTPRAGSPAKPPPRARPGTLSPTFKPAVRATVASDLKPTSARSTPGTPESRHRAQTDVGRFTPELRTRNGSVSLHHAVSFSSLQGSTVSSGSSHSHSPTPPVDHAAHSDTEGRYSPSPSIRIKSKVTRLAKPSSDSLSPTSSQPAYPSTRAGTPRVRAPSVSSSVASASPAPSQPPIFYPITTATPAANPHRYATTRSPPQTAHRYNQPFQMQRNDTATPAPYTRQNGLARVDPAAIPLPPNSPPTSALSFSSRSSVSRSSASVTADDSVPTSAVSASASASALTQNGTGDAERLRSTLDNLLLYAEMPSREDNYSADSGQDRETDGEMESEERKVRAEAKSNRKIADLEITNRSLLAINASLESTKHQQAKEIRELRRKLRESRLILPPRAYRAFKDKDRDATPVDDDEDDDDDNDDDELDNDGDETYKRIKVILEGLIETGKRALERKPQDFPEGGKGGAKVLSADEVRSWRDSAGGGGGGDDHEAAKDVAEADVDVDVDEDVPLSPSRIAVPDSETASEDEVEMTLKLGSMPRSPSPAAPPILIKDTH